MPRNLFWMNFCRTALGRLACESPPLATGQYGSGFGSGILLPNEKVEQLAANQATIPQDAIASLLQRLVLPAWFFVS
jgi:hypothetical protein